MRKTNPEGAIQVYFSGPSSGHNPARVQLLVEHFGATFLVYLRVTDARFLAKELASVIAEMEKTLPQYLGPEDPA